MSTLNPNLQPLTFAGGLYDADTELISFGARDYDSRIGRWTTKDPSGFNGGTTNLYEYGNSDPMSHIDSDGNFAVPLLLFAGYFFYGSLTDTAGQGQYERDRLADVASFFMGNISERSINPFKGKSPEQIDQCFRDKGFKKRGPDPLNGKGDYYNPRTGRSYHIDFKNRYNEPPHVDVNRPRYSPLSKRKYPL